MSVELPREIVEMIYKSCCCCDTPEEAQKEPCACIAAAIVEQIEDWAFIMTETKRDKDISLLKASIVKWENIVKGKNKIKIA